MNGSAERFQHLFRYEIDSHDKVLAAMQSAPDHARAAESFQRAIDMMAHVAAARRMWLWRFGILPDRPDGIFPKSVTLNELTALLDSAHEPWIEYLKQVKDEELPRIMEFTNIAGKRYRCALQDILTQLYGHSLYHRGQISIWKREAGAEPAPTDFVYWSAEPVE